MAVHNIKKEEIPLKAYLRADSYSQHYKFVDDFGGEQGLVTDEMFWGNCSGDKIYVDYTEIPERSIEVTEGISPKKVTLILRNEDCDNWLFTNIIKLSQTKLFVIQGYAGCGKTTFMNKLLREQNNQEFFYIDIGRDWTYQQEPYMFFNETLSAFDRYVEQIVKKPKIREKIWNKFIELGTDLEIKYLDLELPNIIPKFIQIRKNSTWNKLRINIHNYLNENYNDKLLRNQDAKQKNNKIQHNYGQVQTIVSLLVLMICAKFLVNENNDFRKQSYNLIFDNLDIITNPAIPAENVIMLWGLVQKYTDYKNKFKNTTQKKLPNIGVYITVRKVLYSHITAHLQDLEMLAHLSPYLINICDISELYISKDIMCNRIKYWTNHSGKKEVVDKLEKLGEMLKIHENSDFLENRHNEDKRFLNTTINLDAFFNHNYRAFANVFSAFLENNKFSKIVLQDFNKNSTSKSWQKVATLTFEISLLYKMQRVWNKMGFGCNDFDMIDYPTTLNRLILNYLFIAKYGHELRRKGSERSDLSKNDYLSLKDIVDIFEKVKFITVESRMNEKQIEEKYEMALEKHTQNLVIERLAEMCARNPGSYHVDAYGYDSEDDELWRRPMYFIGGVKLNHTATSDKELKTYFENCLKNEKADQILFSITDEGFVLIQDIVASFEFYSARYCTNNLIKPLHQASTANEVENLIKPVYKAISLCCKRHRIFMKQYKKNYEISTEKYLNLKFHPRTIPRFDKDDVLRRYSFRPQLHIVRVIYYHINYFNEIKKEWSVLGDSETNELCKCIAVWMERYLELYKEYFYDSVKNTVCNPDNTVYNDLHDLIRTQMMQYGIRGKNMNIDIGTTNQFS